MPVEADTSEFTYTGDGVTTTFPFPSRFLSGDDLSVGVNSVEQDPSTYAVAGAGSATGGSVVFNAAPAAGARVLLLRKPEASQLVDFVNGQTVLEGTLDNALDKLTMVDQYLLRRADRSLAVGEFDVDGSAGFDARGNTIVNVSPSTAPFQAVVHQQLTGLQDALTGFAADSANVFGSASAVRLITPAPLFGWLQVMGHLSAGDGGAAVYVRTDHEPAHEGKIQDASGGWWDLRHNGYVTLEMFGGSGAEEYSPLQPDCAAAITAATAYAYERGIPVRSVATVYRTTSRIAAPAQRSGGGALVVGGVSTPWDTAAADCAAPVLLPPGVADPAHPSEVPLTTIADGSRWYDAFPRVARLPNGRCVMAAYRGVGHAPSTVYNTPPDSELGPGAWGDITVAVSDDDGATWSSPVSVIGNIASPFTEHYVYTPVMGVAHDGVVLLVVRRIRVSNSEKDLVILRSRDGVLWSAPEQMQVNSIIDNPQTGVGANGQPTDALIFGDVYRVPGAGRGLCLMGRIAGTYATTFEGVPANVTVVNKYLVTSYDDGGTWDWKRCLRYEYRPYANASGVLSFRWERVYPNASVTGSPMTEEGVIVPVSAKEFVTLHRISAVTLLGAQSITVDGGDTWEAVDEAVTGDTEQNGYSMPQSAHLAEIGGVPHIVVHVGTRTSGSATPTSPYSHYVVVAPLREVMLGRTDLWTIVKRQSFQRLFEQDPSKTDGIRDMYIDVVFDGRSDTVLAVTHDEKLSNRTASTHAYRLSLFTDMPVTDVQAAGLTAVGITLMGDSAYGGVLDVRDARAGKVGVAALGGAKLTDEAGATVFEIARRGTIGRVDYVNALPEADNAGHAFRVAKDGVETQVAVVDAAGIKPSGGALSHLGYGTTPPAGALAVLSAGASPMYLDVNTKRLYIATGAGTWSYVTLT